MRVNRIDSGPYKLLAGESLDIVNTDLYLAGNLPGVAADTVLHVDSAKMI